MGLFKKKTNEPVSNDMELNDTVNGSMDTELQESDQNSTRKWKTMLSKKMMRFSLTH